MDVLLKVPMQHMGWVGAPRAFRMRVRMGIERDKQL